MVKRYWYVLVAMMVLSPLGILAKDTKWGEWATDELKETLGYVPQGIEQAGDWWHAIFPDYSIPFLGEGRLAEHGGYILSAIIGSAVIYGITLALTKVLSLSHKAVRRQ